MVPNRTGAHARPARNARCRSRPAFAVRGAITISSSNITFRTTPTTRRRAGIPRARRFRSRRRTACSATATTRVSSSGPADTPRVHFDIFIPMWLKIQEPRELNVMVLVGKSEENTKTLLGDLQAELLFNRRYIADLACSSMRATGRTASSSRPTAAHSSHADEDSPRAACATAADDPTTS